MPTLFPKASPTEVMGLLVLLNSHKGAEDVALLADDLDLEIDEILPSLEFAEELQLVKVSDGHVSFTELGKRLVKSSIRDRKTILREQLKRTTLFRTLLRALENSPDHCLSDEELGQIVALTTAPADEAVQNIVNWGRYADLFRYDSDERRLVLVRRPSSSRSGTNRPPPSGGAATTAPGPAGERLASTAAATNPPGTGAAGAVA